MRTLSLIVAVAIAVVAVPAPAPAQETPDPVVETYDSIADAIIALLETEENFVRTLLEGHAHAAKAAMEEGDFETAAAHISLFANEGDNEVAGIRKRLLDAGHHHNAEAEMEGIYEPGYVVVTKEAKRVILEAASEMRRAETDEARQAAWKKFFDTAHPLVHPETPGESEM